MPKGAGISQDTILKLCHLGFENDFKPILDEILIERVVGTSKHEFVKMFIAEEMKSVGWSVELDSFNARTPLGVHNMTNVIATLNPLADRYLVVACHYDSKKMDFYFEGATDSAVPCAMMIYMAKTLQQRLEMFKTTPLSLMMMFFDGEEAFVEWNESDSLYGSRHLASKMENLRFVHNGRQLNQLHRIEFLMLLDLLGTKNPTFYNYFIETVDLYRSMLTAEKVLNETNCFTDYTKNYFLPMSANVRIDDDHIPFYEKGIEILHIIPNPFPKEWHKTTDNRNALHMPTILNLMKIFQVFLVAYLETQ
ncbi:glutaminyl-peptide cyclotransferase-like isoform X2 [Adelges cooleyi]|uniref:glutaminyl-peptide cyclotransferase-like isoform X2 n=1 Tax=Adelges cooleyi TaxID=133065 RepID=UPI00217FEA2A|nr:glutaminyl-peptide cyclotransferase-like isoform X2 [Adelges cooleyi]